MSKKDCKHRNAFFWSNEEYFTISETSEYSNINYNLQLLHYTYQNSKVYKMVRKVNTHSLTR